MPGSIFDYSVRYHISSLGKESLLKMIDEVEVSEQVYDSNAIENSTLSLDDTEKVLLEVELDRYVSQRELFEAKNLARVVAYISNKAPNKELNIEMVLFLHKMLLVNISDEIAGRFRKGKEYVKVSNHIAPAPNQVFSLLEKAIAYYKGAVCGDIVKRIAKLHLEFENIHPFVDGNGRIGRVILNYLLIREGYVPINIKFVDRKQYYQAFSEFNNHGGTDIMEEIVRKALTNSYHKRLAYLEEKKIMSLGEYAKYSNVSHANLLNKAKRQTIEAFLERGKWKIGA